MRRNHQYPAACPLRVLSGLIMGLLPFALPSPATAQPNDPQERNKLLNEAFEAGLAARKVNDYATAIASFRRAAGLDLRQHAVWANLSDACLGLARTLPEADRQPVILQAIDAMEKALALKPQDAAYLNNYALALAGAKRWDAARAVLLDAARQDPASAGRYHFNLGAILSNSGQTRSAIEAFQLVPAADPLFANAQAQLFRLTLMHYVESARSQFADLRGKPLHQQDGIHIWDSTLALPGAKHGCGILVQPGSHQLSCTFAKGRSAEELAAEYERLVTAVAAALPNWKAADSPEWPGNTSRLPGRRFRGPQTGVGVEILQERQAFSLAISVGNLLAR